jgi:selenoprotein W-related protein
VDLLREELGVDVRLIKGHGGIFEVRVGDSVVAKKTFSGFPLEHDIVRAVAGALQAG